MFTQFKNLIEFQEYFKDEETCRKHLIQARWDGVPVCPYCNSEKVYLFKDGKTFKCAENTCNNNFSVTVGTMYENSKLPLQKWFLAMYLIENHKKGISSCQLARDLGITQRSAWFVLHRIREMHAGNTPTETLEKIVEVDETYVGGKMRNKHLSVRKKAHENNSSHTLNKTMVVGLLQRDKEVQVTVYNKSNETLKDMVRRHVSKDAIVVTDGHNGYKGLDKEFAAHEVVNHLNDEYVNKNGFHTNSIEGFWSQLKRSIYGVYHQVSPKHLHRYCYESANRYNTRKIKDVERFEVTIRKCEGRLKYKDLIK